MKAAITSKGQATIPKAVRDYLGLRTGDHVTFFIQVDGTVALLPKRPAKVMRGIVKAGKLPISLAEMKAAIGGGAQSGNQIARKARSLVK